MPDTDERRTARRGQIEAFCEYVNGHPYIIDYDITGWACTKYCTTQTTHCSVHAFPLLKHYRHLSDSTVVQDRDS